MIRRIAITIALPLLAVAGCAGGSESTQDAPVTTEPTPTTMPDTTPATDAVAAEPQSTTAASNVESTDIDTTLPPDTTATTEAVVVEGTDNSEDAVSEWYNGIADSDLSRMWSIIDPDLKTGVSRSAWDACIAAQFPEVSIEFLGYEEADVYTEDGSVFSTGKGTVESLGAKFSQPITFEVVEREGGWFVMGPVAVGGEETDKESCLTRSAG